MLPARSAARFGLTLCCALFACCCLYPLSARAEQVALDTSACPELPESEVRALLTVELHERLLGPDELERGGSEHVRVRCAGELADLTRVESGARRTLSFASVALPLRARVLALAIAELLRPDEKLPVAKPASKALAPSAAPTTPPPSVQSPRYQLWAGVHGDVLPLLSLGAALVLRVRVAPWFSWSSSFDFSQVRTRIDLGKLRVQNISLRTGPALSYLRSRLTLLLGAGARVSLLRLSGEASDQGQTRQRSFDSWLFSPCVFAGGAVSLGRGAFVALELELGHALRRVRADVRGGGARTLSPWRTSAVLGAGFQW